MMSDDAELFLVMAVCGAGISIFFDFLRSWRIALKSGAAVTVICDIVFVLISFPAAAGCVWNFAGGEFRFYEILGLMLGAVLYFSVFSRLMLRIFLFITKEFLKITAFILKILLTPLLFLYKILLVPVQIIQIKAGGFIRRRKNAYAGRIKKQNRWIRKNP